jgi:hypothetical protein
MLSKQTVLNSCTVEGKTIKLPKDLQLSKVLFFEVAKSINQKGGQWKGFPVNGFVFQNDPNEALNQLKSNK